MEKEKTGEAMNESLPKQHVLIVDDDPANISLLTKLLEFSGYETLSAVNGEQALKIASEEMPDLILLDVMMPGTDGYETCERLKADPETRSIPVIFISGTGNERKGLQLGAVDYIRKPFSTAIIKARVQNHLELKRYRDYLEGLVKERTYELEAANEQLQNEIVVRKQAEAELKNYQDQLENLVEQRTKELMKANEQLHKEIQERIQAENLAKESEEKYRSVFENTGSATIIVEDNMIISMVNAECEKLTGFSKYEIQGRKKWLDFIHEDDAEKIKDYHVRRRAKDPDVPSEYECKMVDSDGNIKELIVNVDLIPGTAKSVASWIDITDRKRSEQALKENEAYLRTIMATIQAGVLIVDPETRTIFDANPCASDMIGCRIDKLVGSSYNDYVACDCGCEGEMNHNDSKPCLNGESCDCLIQKVNGEKIHVRRSYAKAKLKNRDYLIQSFLDITDIKNLLKKQDINIDLSKSILNLVNRVSPRYTEISDGRILFFEGISVPCHKQGGDHYFVRNLSPKEEGGYGKTILTLKDQSGHQVGCVLRSIITDLIHHAVLTSYSHIAFEESINRLNSEVCNSGIFREDDFFTSVNIEIDHGSLIMKYVSAGHPPFILIRDSKVTFLPDTGGEGTNMPIGIMGEGITYNAGLLQLQTGDRLLFYTDGLTEMPENKKNMIISNDDLKKMIEDIIMPYSKMPVSEIMYKILDSISKMSGESVESPLLNTSGDDISILCLEIEDDYTYNERILTPRNTHDVLRIITELYENFFPEWKRRGYKNPETRAWIVLEEGILNAWKHGNKQDPKKSIIVRWRFGNDFRLEIIDEGEGFEPYNIADPTLAENITRVSGRGIFMIRYFTNFVRWESRGRHMIATFSKLPDLVIDEYSQRTERLMKLWGDR